MDFTIYTDGGCKPNPGVMCIGVVIMQNGQVVHRISKQCGNGTSNVAELLALKAALLWAPRHGQIVVYVDSKYVEGLIGKNWTPTKNLELVREVRALFRTFPKIKLLRVKGHNGVEGNELADQLCHRARSVAPLAFAPG